MGGDTEVAVGMMVADRYRIDRVLGEGGMGVVYAAEHIHMRKEVALKVLHGEMCEMPDVVARFEREAVAAANIDHPNVAAATDFGRLPNGAFYLVLEFLKGTSLRDEITKGPIPLDRSLVILRGIANGVAAAHAKGIVHRDLKPENVMLVERDGMSDFVKVLDFGIAKVDAAGAAETPTGGAVLTRVGAIYGTPEYMAPEQAVGDKVDARADIFALGVVFLEMLTGKCPFHGQVLNILRERILMTSPIDMSAITNEGAKALIAKMLERQADDRLQSAADLIAAIDSLETPEPPPAVARNVVTSESLPSANAATNAGRTVAGLVAERPRWLVPAGIVGAFVIVVLAITFGTVSGEKDKDGKHAQASAHGSAKPTARGNLKHAPPALRPPPPPPPPEPPASASTEPDPEPAPSASASAAPTSPTPAAPRPKPAPSPAPAANKKKGNKGSGGGFGDIIDGFKKAVTNTTN